METDNQGWKTYPYLMIDSTSSVEEIDLEEQRIIAIAVMDSESKESMLNELSAYRKAALQKKNTRLRKS
ncbi:MAG: hypothetical protein JOZ78_01035 [Chroococcidiopsidaceae cyanobacterium CP_BM_ER_R8_30]|nr:hypothetical protein [Chroococcidiopsidaceae cyanobacterium CP_BM_ER_R8_30]